MHPAQQNHNKNIAVIIPCYKVRDSIKSVIRSVPSFVKFIICVDDGCPDGSGQLIEQEFDDSRVTVSYHSTNRGVGAAMLTGYQQAIDLGAEIFVKLDGDGQMAPENIPQLVAPIAAGTADYTKGNRFFYLSHLSAMPRTRLLGNAALSFLSKFSTGYWRIFDPTNGFTAIHREVYKLLDHDKIHHRYFFESDMLYQLSTIRAVVQDVPQQAIYGNETSHLNVTRSVPLFASLHTRNFFRRIFYNYFLRDFHLASVEWILGPSMLLFGIVFGLVTWTGNVSNDIETPIGTVMLAALPIILGLQLLLSALGFDIDNQPRQPIAPQLDAWTDD